MRTSLVSCFSVALLEIASCGKKDNFPFESDPAFISVTYPGEWQGESKTGTHLRLVGNFNNNFLTETFKDGWRRTYVTEEGEVKAYFRVHPERPRSTTVIGGKLGDAQPLLQKDYDTALRMIYYKKHYKRDS